MIHSIKTSEFYDNINLILFDVVFVHQLRYTETEMSCSQNYRHCLVYTLKKCFRFDGISVSEYIMALILFCRKLTSSTAIPNYQLCCQSGNTFKFRWRVVKNVHIWADGNQCRITFYMPNCDLRNHERIFAFSIIYPHSDGTGSWNTAPW